MDILRQMTDEELEKAYEEVFREAFPPQELKPLESIRQMTAGGYYHPCALFRDGEPVGFICFWLNEPYVLIDYLCVPKNIRNGGIGAQMIRLARETYPENTVFIGEVEAPTGNPEEDAIILRRLAFYARCGAITLGYDTALFGVHYKTIVWTNGEVNEAEVLKYHDEIYRRRFTPEMYDLAIQIPLHEGEEPRVFDEWIEDRKV
ncbi:MAG: GNAT family N-acetyltransferase [Oscillospiraceae bacterium]|nr:GNAT family N-acetyltransferase [Oscillospiraceae bacterium]